VAAVAHAGQARLNRPEGAGQVHVDVALPLLGRHPVRRRDRVGDRGVRHAHVDVAQVRQRVARQVHAQVGAVGHVERHDLEAVLAEPLRDRRADPARAARDERLRHQRSPAAYSTIERSISHSTGALSSE
jgi:hypothetical protein